MAAAGPGAIPEGDTLTAMPTHPLWRPFEQPTEEQIAAASVGAVSRPPDGRVAVVPADPEWPAQATHLIAAVRAALEHRALAVEHVGSTSVPGLWAKPVIDLDLTVADSSDEDAYVPALEGAGFRLTIREPEWEQHRCLVHSNPRCNLHVFSPGAVEPRRHRAFRDWLRTHDDDRDRYAALKRSLAEQHRFRSVMDYNNRKATLIYDIYERIFIADPEWEHDPQPGATARLETHSG